MKKLDKLIIQSFLGPFILTFLVVVFILLTQYMLKYFDEFVGKNLGFQVFAELIMYFSINMTPVALPLAVLLSSLMTYGNLGEHSELTAIKGTGISMLRTLRPIFIFVIFLTVIAYFSNSYFVPMANLNAYSLLYDIKQKKPSMDIREGAFYNGLPRYSIKVNKKYPDGVTLGDIIIYDHTKGQGNTDIIMADSGKMYTIYDDRYMMLELFRGNSYSETQSSEFSSGPSSKKINPLLRNNFLKSKMVFDLSSFDLKRTQKELFATNRLMRNIDQLKRDIDSIDITLADTKYQTYSSARSFYNYHLKEQIDIPEELIEKRKDTTFRRSSFYDGFSASPVGNYQQNVSDSTKTQNRIKRKVLRERRLQKTDSLAFAKVDSVTEKDEKKRAIIQQALDQARFNKNQAEVQASLTEVRQRELNIFIIEKHKKYTMAFACMVMFLIGAPLGAIIKKGGLGIPVIISISFFIVFYVLSMIGEKWAKESLVDPIYGVWAANVILLPFGIIFLRQARVDARLFDADFYNTVVDKIVRKFKKRAKADK